MKKLARFAVVMAVCGCGIALGQPGAAAPNAKTGPDANAATAASDDAVVMATPAMWRVKGAHGTVYLFGSVHVMKPNVVWEIAKVKEAMTSSDTLYLEIANIDDTASAQPIILKFGIDAAHPLSTKISKEDVALLDAAAKTMGLPGEQAFEPMQPWLVSVTLSTLPLTKAGFDPASGIDMKLVTKAR